MSFREHHSRWEFDLKSSPESLWPFVADTNRFNRDTGLPKIETKHGHKRLRNARRKLRLSVYGLPVEWEEQPFEWIRPVRFGVERIYSKGPMASLRALAELTEKPDGGTHMTYELWATPRNLVGSVIIPLHMNFVAGPKFRAAIHEYDELAFSGTKAATSNPDTSLSSFDLSRLETLHQKLIASVPQSRSIVDRLANFLQQGDDFD